MAKYNLQHNEFMIMKTNDVLLLSSNIEDNELILTNTNLVMINGVESRNPQTKIFPLSHIKLFNGRPQVIIDKQSSGDKQVDIYFTNGQESFEFNNKKDAIRWAEAIRQVLTGNLPEEDTSKLMAIPGTEMVAATLKGTFDTVKGVFGVNQKGSNKTQNVNVTVKCIGCGAPLAGIQGRRTKCRYCDTEQNL